MAIFLDELQAGSAQDLIGFPNLRTCMGLVLQTRAFLYGCHIAGMEQDTVAAQAEALKAYIRDVGGNVNNGVRLYGCCNWKARYEGGGRRAAWERELSEIARILGYTGTASGFDTGVVVSEPGVYLEYRPEYGKEKCRIFYKKDAKMGYATEFRQVSATGRGFKPFGTKPVSLTDDTLQLAAKGPNQFVDQKLSATGNLHELNYFLRLISFTV